MAIAERWLSSECIQAALGTPPRGVGIPVLRQPWVDRTLARAHPAFPLAFFGPLAVLILVWARGAGTLLTLACSALAGWFVWTLVEYVLHRFLFHMRFAETREAKLSGFLMHGYHHAYPRDPTRLVLPPIVSVPLACSLFVLAHFLLGGGAIDAGFAGFLLGYVSYDSLHYVVHHTKKTTGVTGWMRRYHLLHHHDHAPARYGVSSPLWDLILGTFRDARRARR
ncbi:MAG TPA: sterol desaturase family protein [Labilithrix sp.]|nr:sterol desaturase family protein [Labilithrix sp.]